MNSNPQQEHVNLFFNADHKIAKVDNPDVDFKHYIMRQNEGLLEKNRELILENKRLEDAKEETEEELMTSDKRLKNTKEFLKNFRFINDNLVQIVDHNKNTIKKFQFSGIIVALRIGSSLAILFALLFLFFGIINFFSAIFFTIVTCLKAYFLIGFIQTYQEHKKENDKFIKLKLKEIAELKKTMDIISEFVDNAL